MMGWKPNENMAVAVTVWLIEQMGGHMIGGSFAKNTIGFNINIGLDYHV